MLKTKTRGIINLGYPCICRCLKSGKVTSKVTQKYLLNQKTKKDRYKLLIEKSQNNLIGLSNTVDWTYLKNIKFYRIYSDLFPHITNKKLEDMIGVEEAEEYRSLDLFENEIREIGKKIFEYKIRVSFHPNEFVCLGSPKEDVVKAGVIDLAWHGRMVSLFKEGVKLGLGEKEKAIDEEKVKKEEEQEKEDEDEEEEDVEKSEDKEDKESEEDEVDEHFRHSVFVLHGGGVYGDKEKAIERWENVYNGLPAEIKDHLVIENDERNYSPMDLIEFSERAKIPIVIDWFHQDCYEEMHPKEDACDWDDILPRVLKVWQERKMKPKFHISLQQPERRLGTHSHFCDTLPEQLKDLQDSGTSFDIMLECKAKEVALFRCYENNKDRIDMEDKLGAKKRKEKIKKMNKGKLPDFSEHDEETVMKQIVGVSGSMKASQRSGQLKKTEKGNKRGKKKEKMIEEVEDAKDKGESVEMDIEEIEDVSDESFDEELLMSEGDSGEEFVVREKKKGTKMKMGKTRMRTRKRFRK
jgi:UV DNA damage endonuclease